MRKEELEKEQVRLLLEDRKLHPDMQAQDMIKFLMQGMVGNGHLLSSPKQMEASLKLEMDSVGQDHQEPLTEAVSPYWMRLNLRRARAEQLTPQQIVQLMLLTDRLLRKTRAFYMPHFTRKDVYECCGHFASIAVMHATETQTGEMDLVIQIGKEKTRILDPRWLPSHSELYRNHYHPAYRIISAAWAPYLDAICGISRCAASGAKILVTLDGSCACGKTTLAELLSDVFDADVIHTDEYVVPHAQKTPQRLSVPGGNCDWERLTEEVLIPWKKGQQGIYRPYDCKMDQLREMESFPDKQILILEGSYSNLPAIRKLAGVRLFLNVPYEERIRRLTVRESEESLKNYYRKWIPLEDAYFQAYGLPDDGMIVIHGASFASTDPC